MEPIVSGFQFPLFDSVPELDDHHYIQSKDCLTDHNNPVYATIMKEWKILEKNIPESIYVRVSETRINLLRAVIIGAPETPYHDGLFFFDISLPHNYPQSPPKVYYHSYGYHLNPNLYSNGKICLSLINTWEGKGTEKWTTNSTILQVLASIQGLVLNSKPYYNEPVASRLLSFEKLSLIYNQKVFILSCKTMIQVMQNPPKGFEDFVFHHFGSRSCSILRATDDWMNESRLSRSFISNYLSGTCHSDFSVLKSDLKKRFVKIPGAAMAGEEVSDRVENVRVKPRSLIRWCLWFLVYLFVTEGFNWMRSRRVDGDGDLKYFVWMVATDVCIWTFMLISYAFIKIFIYMLF